MGFTEAYMEEIFAKPAVSAIIEKTENGKTYILVQRRRKKDPTGGLLEVVGGKIREYENVFDALKREVYEETGLMVTKIYGEDECAQERTGSVSTIGFEPFCVTQNLCGIYSLIMLTFICNAEGEPAKSTDEATDIRWASLEEIESLLENAPETIFPMDVLPLRKYLRSKKAR